jgi:hypothetical protein
MGVRAVRGPPGRGPALVLAVTYREEEIGPAHPSGCSASVFETAAAEANRAGQAGREATLHLGAFQLACRHRSLAGRRPRLEHEAIWKLVSVGRWSELDPLVRSAWPRRGALPEAEPARLAAAFSAHLFWTGSLDQALAVAKDELANLEECGALDEAGVLLREAAVIAWFKDDGASARIFADRALDVARRTGDLDLEIRAGRIETVIAYGAQGNPQVATSRLRENAAIARAQGLAIPEGSGTVVSVVRHRHVARRPGGQTGVRASRRVVLGGCASGGHTPFAGGPPRRERGYLPPDSA